MQSPITGSTHTSQIDTIDSQLVISAYERVGVDATRFFVNTPQITINKCEESGYRFFAPLGIAGDGQFYADLQANRYNYYSADKWEYTKALPYIQKGDKVLEIGCATGLFLTQMKEKGAEVEGIELNHSALEIARKAGFTVHDKLIEDFAPDNAGKYDAVCFFQVLEHITEVKPFLDNVLKVVRKGGKIIIAVPNSNPYLFRYDKIDAFNLPPHHTGLWDRQTFERLPKFFPLRLVNLKVEPLYAVKHQLGIMAKHSGYHSLAKLIQKTPNFMLDGFSFIARHFWEGRNIFVVFEKM